MATQMIKGAKIEEAPLLLAFRGIGARWRATPQILIQNKTLFEVLKWPVHGVSCTTIQAMYPLRKSHLMDNTLVRGHGG